MAAKPSFCLLSTFYPPASFGGDGVHVRQLANGLAKRGHRVRVIHNPTAFRMAGGREGYPARADLGVEVIPLSAGRASTTSTYLTGRSPSQRRELERLVSGFDVVHFHNPSLLGGPGAFDLGDGARLYTTHEHWLMCPTHVLYRFGREICPQRTCVRCCISYRRPPQFWRFGGQLQRSVTHLDALLCPSRFTAALHRREFPAARVEVLPLPAPEGPALSPVSGLGEHEQPFFLYAGRLEAIKGAKELIGVFPRVTGAHLLVAGTGSQDALLREQAAGCSRIRFLGRLAHDEVLAFARAAAAVVVPSVGYETFGAIAVEAMAVGTPVVVRALGPLVELVEDGGGVTFSDDDDLVRVLQGLVDAPSRRRALGNRAKEVAATRFHPDHFFDRYLAIAADIVDSRKALPR